MKKSIIAAVAIALTTGLFSAPAVHADPRTPGIDKREHRQGVRIWRGVKNGSLTPRETAGLLRGQVRVRRAERRARSDGRVTPRERVRLHRQLNRQSRRIWRRKHN